MRGIHPDYVDQWNIVNPVCARCSEVCKQAAAVEVIYCPHFTGTDAPWEPAASEVEVKERPVRQRPVIGIRETECQSCGRTFRPTASAQRYCSPACAKNGRRAKDRALKREQRMSGHAEL